jgi:hypothetical protein
VGLKSTKKTFNTYQPVVVIGYKMCLFPIRAQKNENGKPSIDPEGDILLPCGKCYECKSKRASEWALRCRHEISCHDENCFLTLTYDDENLPSQLIVKEYFQKFIKRLRKTTPNKVKYIVSHEYGGKSGRPHHHAILFGWTPPKQSFLTVAPSGEPLFCSTKLDQLWPYGYHSIGEANEKTAYYIASYSLKSNSHNVLCDDTGEIVTVNDSMNCSTRPAIGKEYFLKNADTIVANEPMLPRYYVKLLEKEYPDLFEEYQNKCLLNIKEKSSHEKYAKYVITEQKERQAEDGFRSAPDDVFKTNFYKDHLKKDRDLYKTLQQKRSIHECC